MIKNTLNYLIRSQSFIETVFVWSLLIVSLLLLITIFQNSLLFMINNWHRDEYSHAYMIPIVSLFLIWRKKNELISAKNQSSWLALIFLIISLAILNLDISKKLETLPLYVFIFSIGSVVLAFAGAQFFAIIWIPIFYLIFMVPLPENIYNLISNYLQQLTATISVVIIHLFGIDANLEGEIIDIGDHKLQVIEACNGLRYLLPLSSFSFLIAHLYIRSFWPKVILFISTIPITIVMNCLRVALIAVTIKYWGIKMANGILHSAEGWIVFMGCLGLLYLEVLFFNRITKNTMNLSEKVDNTTLPLLIPKTSFKLIDKKPFIISLIIIIMAKFFIS